MFRQSRRLLSTSGTPRRPARSLGAVVAALTVAACTALIYPLGHIAPTLSLSVVYLPAVLLVATLWGLPLGLLTALLSAAAFNFFHIPPVGRFTIANSRNWVALAAFVVVAAVTGVVAEIARSRSLEAERGRREADLTAALARELLGGVETERALAGTAHRIAVALGFASAGLLLGAHEPPDRRRGIALSDATGAQIATLIVPRDIDPAAEERLQMDVVPSLAALVAIALRRDALQAEAVETAALRRSDDVKTAVLRAVSHDLRTPLTAIVAAGHALSSTGLSGHERAELSQAVVEEGERLARLVENLLDLSRLQAGSARARLAWTSLEDVLSAALESIPGGGGAVRLSLAEPLPDLQADGVQLERAFANLIENAVRHTGEAPVRVVVERFGDSLRTAIVDQGPGIEVAELERIFEPFYRGPHARSGGSGLGLAIARGFVEANGGAIDVQSLPGQGTTFTVTLPLAVPQAPAASTATQRS